MRKGRRLTLHDGGHYDVRCDTAIRDTYRKLRFDRARLVFRGLYGKNAGVALTIDQIVQVREHDTHPVNGCARYRWHSIDACYLAKRAA